MKIILMYLKIILNSKKLIYIMFKHGVETAQNQIV